MKLVGSRRVFAVEDVTARLATMFEGLRSFWVEAEVQDLRFGRGQVYLRLRGEHLMDASMNRIVYDRLPHKPRDGTLVQAYGRMELWRARTQVGMRVERLELAGQGLLLAQVEELRRRLEAEGLLDVARKRRPPMLPRRVGLVTSADGAAREDFLRNAWARFPRADVVLVAVPVQGDLAPELIARALRHLGRVPGVDVVVVARGGGSLEDLMAFNSEVVCRAVAAVPVPVVSAVGHERDVTVCDLVADLRVSAPSAAAEAVLPSLEALEVRLGDGAQALVRALRGRGDRAGDRVDGLAGRLAPALARLAARAPGEVAAREALLRRAASARAESAAGRLERVQALLSLLSPGRTVARGYAIVRDAASDGVIASAGAVAPGQELSIELRDGRVLARAGEAA